MIDSTQYTDQSIAQTEVKGNSSDSMTWPEYGQPHTTSVLTYADLALTCRFPAERHYSIQLPSGDCILNEESPLSSKAIPATTQNPPDLSFLIALPVTAAQAAVKGTSRRNVRQRPEYTTMSDVNGSKMQIWGSQLSVSWSKMALLLLDLEIHYRFRNSPARSLLS